MVEESSISKLKQDLSAIDTGYGLMSLTWRAEPVPEAQAHDIMKKVVELAKARGHKAFFNVGEFYGANFVNLTYVKDFFAKYPALRKDVIISCKGAIELESLKPTGKYGDVVRSIERSVEAIGGFIDIFEVARLDLSLLNEGEVYPYESFKAIAEAVDNGTIGGISLSEVNAEQIRAIHKDWHRYLVSVEVELSMYTRAILTNGVVEATNDLHLVTILYSPLGRGLLTGAITSSKDIPKGDFRSTLKRFTNDSLKQNLILVDFLKEEIIDKRPADSKITLPQVALGWDKFWNKTGKYPNTHFLPIPSGSSLQKLDENFNEAKAQITAEEFAKINEFLKDFKTVGGQYEAI